MASGLGRRSGAPGALLEPSRGSLGAVSGLPGAVLRAQRESEKGGPKGPRMRGKGRGKPPGFTYFWLGFLGVLSGVLWAFKDVFGAFQ